MARTNLGRIAAMTTRLREEAVEGRAALHTGTGVPGGEALVMLAPGTYRPRHYPRPEHETPADANPPLVVLAYWANYWTRGGTAPINMADVCRYLDDNLHHMAQTHAFPGLANDLGRTRHHLENVLHEGVRDEVSRVPCWECGTRLVKQYGTTEAGDHWLCPRCKERYDRGRYDRAKHDHLFSEGADRYVLLADAAAAVGRSMRTVQTWMHRGLVTARRDPQTGRWFVWWPDVRTRHQAAPTRRRQA